MLRNGLHIKWQEHVTNKEVYGNLIETIQIHTFTMMRNHTACYIGDMHVYIHGYTVHRHTFYLEYMYAYLWHSSYFYTL